MFDRPRNWKWMVPGILVGPCLVWWSQWAALEAWRTYAPIPLTVMVVMGLAAVFNGLLYVYHYSADMYAERRASENNTPEVRMFEAAKGMHPEAVKALLTHRRTLWRLKYIPIKDLVDWVLDEAPNVHAGFVDFVLDNSSSLSLMPKRMLSEGSKKFDPEGQVTDYEQYDELTLLMEQKLMVTSAYGSSRQWIPPYTRELARHRFGLDEAVYEEPEGMLETVREQLKPPKTGNGNGRLEQLEAESEPKPQRAKPTTADEVPPLTDEEWENIQKLIGDKTKMSQATWLKLKKAKA